MCGGQACVVGVSGVCMCGVSGACVCGNCELCVGQVDVSGARVVTYVGRCVVCVCVRA